MDNDKKGDEMQEEIIQFRSFDRAFENTENDLTSRDIFEQVNRDRISDFGDKPSRAPSLAISDRFFTNEPPSSLFDFETDSTSILQSQSKSRLSEKSDSMNEITPQDHRVPMVRPTKYPRDSPNKTDTSISQDITMTPKQNEKDPFLEHETTIKASKKFQIKTSISNPFKGFLSDSQDLPLATTTPCSIEPLESNMDISKESNPYDFENPFSLYRGEVENDQSVVEDDFEELQSNVAFNKNLKYYLCWIIKRKSLSLQRKYSAIHLTQAMEATPEGQVFYQMPLLIKLMWLSYQ